MIVEKLYLSIADVEKYSPKKRGLKPNDYGIL